MRRIDAGTVLQHVSRCIYRDEPLFFGTSRANRYDAPQGEYGVLYLGRDLPTALMESVFHKHQWHLSNQRSITLTEVRSRLVRVVGLLQPLLLADLTAEGVMAAHLGLSLEQLAGRDYLHTQRASLAIHRTTDKAGRTRFDGVLYPSRNNYPGTSIALFDRAKDKVKVVADIGLIKHVDWPGFVARYHIGIVPGPDPV